MCLKSTHLLEIEHVSKLQASSAGFKLATLGLKGWYVANQAAEAANTPIHFSFKRIQYSLMSTKTRVHILATFLF